MTSTTIEQNAMRYAQAIVSQMQYERVPAMMQHMTPKAPKNAKLARVLTEMRRYTIKDGVFYPYPSERAACVALINQGFAERHDFGFRSIR